MSERLLDEIVKLGEMARTPGTRFVLNLPPGALENIQWDADDLSEWWRVNQSLLEGATLERLETDIDREVADTYALALEAMERRITQASAIPAKYFESTEKAGRRL